MISGSGSSQIEKNKINSFQHRSAVAQAQVFLFLYRSFLIGFLLTPQARRVVDAVGGEGERRARNPRDPDGGAINKSLLQSACRGREAHPRQVPVRRLRRVPPPAGIHFKPAGIHLKERADDSFPI